LRPRLKRAARVCFDYTGPGVGLGDFLKTEFGEYKPAEHQFGKIELCQFTVGLKRELFPKLRMAFDQKQVGIPINRVIREDLHSLHRVANTGGDITYRAPHTTDGHADRCTALALALRAASLTAGVPGLRNLDGFRWQRQELAA
jgi:phage FluMu gp28-like protein